MYVAEQRNLKMPNIRYLQKMTNYSYIIKV